MVICILCFSQKGKPCAGLVWPWLLWLTWSPRKKMKIPTPAPALEVTIQERLVSWVSLVFIWKQFEGATWLWVLFCNVSRMQEGCPETQSGTLKGNMTQCGPMTMRRLSKVRWYCDKLTKYKYLFIEM